MQGIVTVVLLIFWAGVRPAFGDTVRFDVEGKANVSCRCVAATSGCSSAIFDRLAGSQRHTWVQEISVRKGMTLDLSEVCYSKRDVDKVGAGLCCEAASKSEALKRFFEGKKQ